MELKYLPRVNKQELKTAIRAVKKRQQKRLRERPNFQAFKELVKPNNNKQASRY